MRSGALFTTAALPHGCAHDVAALSLSLVIHTPPPLRGKEYVILHTTRAAAAEGGAQKAAREWCAVCVGWSGSWELELTPLCVRGRRVCARASAAAARVAPVRIDYKGEVIHSQTLSAPIIRKRSQLSSPSVHLCHTML